MSMSMSFSFLEYLISTATTDLEDAGSDANIYVKITGDKGTSEMELENPDLDDFERGRLVCFIRYAPRPYQPCLGKINKRGGDGGGRGALSEP